MRNLFWSGLLAAALVVAPVSASAQCGMMGGGGHQHDQGKGHQHEQKSSQGVDKKAKRKAQKLLNDPKGRDALLEAILEDPGFTRLLAARLSADPEWRALLLESPGAQPEAVYHCPMHPDVASDGPGACPKCGMALERASDTTAK